MAIDRDKKLKDGITTGSCAAAAAAAAIETYLGMSQESVTIDLPESSRKISIDIHKTGIRLADGKDNISSAVVIKNAGDDPDITHGAMIGVELYITPHINNIVIIRGGKGVGTVTRPGLPIKEGEAAINPVPRRMIEHEILSRIPEGKSLRVIATVFIEDGERLAKNTLNPRLGIVGGLSVLGTTGIVKPYSAKSYKETIDICLGSARSNNQETCVLSTGRKSEKLAQRLYPELDEKCFVQTADFFSYALKKAVKTGFRHIILSCFFGKLCKWAMNMKYTHARSGLTDFDFLSQVAADNGCSGELSEFIKTANNARQIFESGFKDKELFIEIIGNLAVKNAGNMSDNRADITVCLFDYEEELFRRWELKNR
ncbi:MAG: cobalamin biosynthesis protein CbiD [Deltaproteobacteria bacterium]|nr:cobalamin biosynthesis protein CbiD [Deltaproteobacteria bacterium]